MVNETDSRSARRTKHLFKHALLRLLETESFAYITVKDIVDQADFNRTTFYNHYIDKFDLLDDVSKDLLAEVSNLVQSNFQKFNPGSSFKMRKTDITLFDYFYHNRSSLSIWMQGDTYPNFSQHCSQTIQNTLVEIWLSQSNMDERKLISFCKMFSYTLMGTISEWISENFATSPDIITQEFVDFFNCNADNEFQ